MSSPPDGESPYEQFPSGQMPPARPGRFAPWWVVVGVVLTSLVAGLVGALVGRGGEIQLTLLTVPSLLVGFLMLFLTSRAARSIGFGLLIGWALLPFVMIGTCLAVLNEEWYG